METFNKLKESLKSWGATKSLSNQEVVALIVAIKVMDILLGYVL